MKDWIKAKLYTRENGWMSCSYSSGVSNDGIKAMAVNESLAAEKYDQETASQETKDAHFVFVSAQGLVGQLAI